MILCVPWGKGSFVHPYESKIEILMRFQLRFRNGRRLGYRLIDRIDAFLSSLPDRTVLVPVEQGSCGSLNGLLPEFGEDAGKVLDEVCREMRDKGFHLPSANYFGRMNPTPTYMGVLAEALVAALNPQLATLARSQLASKIELETVRWIGKRAGWPGEFNGTRNCGRSGCDIGGPQAPPSLVHVEGAYGAAAIFSATWFEASSRPIR